MEVGSPKECHSHLGSRGVYSIRRPEARPTFPSWASPHNAHPQGSQGTLQRVLTTSSSRRETLTLLMIRLSRPAGASGFLLWAGMAPSRCSNWLSWQPPMPLVDEKQMLNYNFLMQSVW